MKSKLILGLLLLGALPMLNSCKDDEDPEPPSPLIGSWERDVYQLADLPSTFSNFDGVKFTAYWALGEENYTLTFTNDKKYNRKVAITGSQDINDNGVWTYEGSTVTLDSDDEAFDNEEFEVEGEITANDLVLSKMETLALLPDAVTDTLTDAWYNAHQQEIDDQYQQNVDVKVLFLFEK